MISMEKAQRIAQAWVDAWNAHDLEAIMEHYVDTIEFWSPLIIRRFGISSGKIEGKVRLREYFAGGLTASSNLHFTLLKVFVGVDSITISYSRHDGSEAAEMMVLNESSDQATMVRVHYNPHQ
jgi:hypothetical protein